MRFAAFLLTQIAPQNGQNEPMGSKILGILDILEILEILMMMMMMVDFRWIID